MSQLIGNRIDFVEFVHEARKSQAWECRKTRHGNAGKPGMGMQEGQT